MPLVFRSILLTFHEGKILFEGAVFFAQVLDIFLLGLALRSQGLALPVLGLALGGLLPKSFQNLLGRGVLGRYGSDVFFILVIYNVKQ